LMTVVECIKTFPSTVFVALISVLFQIAWLITWVLAVAGIWHALDINNQSQGKSGLSYFLLLVSLYWSIQVIKNVVHVTVAGVFASWYWLYPSNMPSNPTMAAFKRAMWSSFGSVCLGSLLVAIVQALRAMVEQGKRSRNDFLRCIVLCLLQCLENMIRYFNVYAFTQVAIYGKTYCQAARDTWELFNHRGLDMIINDNLISGVLTVGCLIVGLFTGGIGLILTNKAFNMEYWVVWSLIAFVIGVAMALCAMEVVASCVAACFVSYAEDPDALKQTKPEIYNRFSLALEQRRTQLRSLT